MRAFFDEQPKASTFFDLERRIFSQGQENQGVVRRRTTSSPHNQIPQIDAEIVEKGPLQIEKLDETLIQHRIHHLNKPGNIGPHHVIARRAILFGCLPAGLVNALHDQFQAIIHLFARPG